MNISENKFRQLLDRYLKGHASAEEKRVLDNFFKSYEREFDDVGGDEKTRLEILGRIQSQLERRPSRNLIWLGVAASVAVAAVLSYLALVEWQKSERPTAVQLMTEYAPAGQKLSVILPDGTSVFLNAGSRVSYPETFAPSTREVTLQGEAYFDVKSDKNKPFIIAASNSTTRVTGTSFNVRAQEGENVAVTLVDGSVEVRSQAGASELRPGQQAIIDKNSASIITLDVDINKYISWKDNIIYFESIPLKDAVKTLELWYGTDITLSNKSLGECVLTGKYQDESLENVLESFEFLLKVKYKLTDNHVTISGNGCK